MQSKHQIVSIRISLGLLQSSDSDELQLTSKSCLAKIVGVDPIGSILAHDENEDIEEGFYEGEFR